MPPSIVLGATAVLRSRIAGASILSLLAAVLTSASQADDKTLYRSSVVGTEFDFIRETDPDLFVELDYTGQGTPEMPDKTSRSAPLRKPAFQFVSRYRDGTSIALAIDAAFATEAEARREALRYTPRLGKLPTSLRRGVDRVVVHKGGADATAFSDVGLIVLYSDNATRRIGTHDLEETVFHESVHASWDKAHAASPEWRAAQKSDGRFVTEYARKNPDGEDLAESALFAYTLLHHPERISPEESARIKAAIPARIAFVGSLLPPGKPVHFMVCRIDLTRPGPMSDILSNALVRGCRQDEGKVRAFLDGARDRYSDSEKLLGAAADAFGIEAKVLRAQIEAYRHASCTHGRLEDIPAGGRK